MSLSIGIDSGLENVFQKRFNPQQAFNKIDTDGSGTLNIKEFGKISKKFSKVSGKEMNVDDVFSKLDSNEDGNLSADEMQILSDKMKSAIKDKLSRAMSNSKGDLQSQLNNIQDEKYKNLLDLFNDQDAKEGTFSLVDVQV